MSAGPGRRLEGKVAVVTGASRGIGRAIAEKFAREGARLVLHQRTDASEEARLTCTALGAEVVPVTGDVSMEETARAILRAALDRFGRLDVLVNNAGVAHDGLLATLSDEELERMVATNVLGVVRVTRAALRPMIEQRSGSVIHLSSVLASRPGAGNAVYSGTKGFVESFTRSLAAEVGRKGIRVNAIAPGVVESRMSEGVMALAGDRVLEKIGLRRLGTPEEVAALAAFLASDEAAYVSGSILPIDGAYGAA